MRGELLALIGALGVDLNVFGVTAYFLGVPIGLGGVESTLVDRPLGHDGRRGGERRGTGIGHPEELDPVGRLYISGGGRGREGAVTEDVRKAWEMMI